MSNKISKKKAGKIRVLSALGMPVEQIARELDISRNTAETYANFKKKGFDNPEAYKQKKSAGAKRNESTIGELITENDLVDRYNGKIKIPFCPECKSLIKRPFPDTPYIYCTRCKRSYLFK